MYTVMITRLKILISILFISQFAYAVNPIIQNLSATYRSGQIFLTWDEAQTPKGTFFNVYVYNKPITAKNIKQAELVGHHIEQFSATDWWLNPVSFNKKSKADITHGFVIQDGKELSPLSGLFVHTVRTKDADKMYFAVTSAYLGKESLELISGSNTLKEPINGEVSMSMPIQLKNAPAQESAKGQTLTIKLHGRGGDVSLSPKSNFLFFGDASMGWREGLAHKFLVYKKTDGIVIEPYDRLWVARPLLYSTDERDHVPAVNTWWYGSNNKIYDNELSKSGVVVNYTEKYLVHLAKWAQQYFGTDPQKTYITGNSMGGTGAISVGLHHPDVFSTIFSTVPLPAYTRKADQDKKTNIARLDVVCGRICDETVMTDEGISVLDRMNSEKLIAESKRELPFIVLMNGRTDGSMPWVNNPSFYKQLDESKIGYTVYWNNGGHDMAASAPEDIVRFYNQHPQINLNTSYPAFSKFSDNKNPGSGEKENGDLEGWMNRGLYWDNISDAPQSWTIEVQTKAPVAGATTVDITPRRLQQFKVKKNEQLTVTYNGSTDSVQADEQGMFTIRQVKLPLPHQKVKIEITRKK